MYSYLRRPLLEKQKIFVDWNFLVLITSRTFSFSDDDSGKENKKGKKQKNKKKKKKKNRPEQWAMEAILAQR